MKRYTLAWLFASLFAFTTVFAQQKENKIEPDRINKKFLWGLSFNNYWSSIEGNDAQPGHFYKPSLGGSLKAEFYPVKFLGFGVAAGYQQRGTGIIVTENPYDLTDPSLETYRTRLRFNYIDVPLTLILRTPNTISNGSVRLSGSVGINPQYMFKATQIRHSVEDGFHDTEDKTDSFKKMDMGLIGSFGADINTGGCILQVHLVGNWGTKNVYNNELAYPGYQGKNSMYGIRLGFMF